MTKSEIVRSHPSSIVKKSQAIVMIQKKVAIVVVVRYTTMMMLEEEIPRQRERRPQIRKLILIGKIKALERKM